MAGFLKLACAWLDQNSVIVAVRCHRILEREDENGPFHSRLESRVLLVVAVESCMVKVLLVKLLKLQSYGRHR
jgi:hypothetical protein